MFPGDPDPCAESCIFQSFGHEAMTWYNLFRKAARGHIDKENGPVRWEIDYGAVGFLFDAYGVTETKEGLDVLYEIVSIYDDPDVTDEQILYPEED